MFDPRHLAKHLHISEVSFYSTSYVLFDASRGPLDDNYLSEPLEIQAGLSPSGEQITKKDLFAFHRVRSDCR